MRTIKETNYVLAWETLTSNKRMRYYSRRYKGLDEALAADLMTRKKNNCIASRVTKRTDFEGEYFPQFETVASYFNAQLLKCEL